jgi:hypothetical protein
LAGGGVSRLFDGDTQAGQRKDQTHKGAWPSFSSVFFAFADVDPDLDADDDWYNR